MFFRFTVLLFHIPTVCWCHICAKNLCNSKICITDSWLWRDVKLGSVRIVAVSLPVDGDMEPRYGRPLSLPCFFCSTGLRLCHVRVGYQLKHELEMFLKDETSKTLNFRG